MCKVLYTESDNTTQKKPQTGRDVWLLVLFLLQLFLLHKEFFGAFENSKSEVLRVLYVLGMCV